MWLNNVFSSLHAKTVKLHFYYTLLWPALTVEYFQDFTDKFKAPLGLASGDILALLVLYEPQSSQRTNNLTTSGTAPLSALLSPLKVIVLLPSWPNTLESAPLIMYCKILTSLRWLLTELPKYTVQAHSLLHWGRLALLHNILLNNATVCSTQAYLSYTEKIDKTTPNLYVCVSKIIIKRNTGSTWFIHRPKFITQLFFVAALQEK